MLYRKKGTLLCMLTLTGYLSFSIVFAAQAFITIEHQQQRKHNVLINKVHEKSWTIGYRYDSACPAEARQNSKKLEEAITTALQAWLQPIRDMPITEPIVNDFRYEQRPDMVNNDKRFLDKRFLALDLRVTFYCLEDISNAFIGLSLPPDIHLRQGTIVTNAFMSSIVHELGHAMGLGDTYVKDIASVVSKGGIKGTVGTQPPSLMSSHLHHISKDDVNGVIWLYKRVYENLNIDDCFFQDYEFENSPDGCRPKYPLIFEIKQGNESFALQMIDQDRSLNINVQDRDGRTAMHHAVIGKQFLVVQMLLSEKNIKPNVKDAEGYTPAQLANKLGLKDIWRFIVSYPTRRLTTTWGSLKREY